MGLNVDDPLGRGAQRNKQWPGGLMVYAIHPDLGTFLDSLKNVFYVSDAPFRIKVPGIYLNFYLK